MLRFAVRSLEVVGRTRLVYPRLMRARVLGLGVTLVLSFLTNTQTVRADEWLTFRHDPRRTGAARGVAHIERPTIHWRRYLGGQLTGYQFFPADVDGDGTNEIVYVAGGKVIAKRPDNVILWESPLMSLDHVVGSVDMDGDGTNEILAIGYEGHRVVLLSGRDGRVVWQLPDGPIGTAATVHITDLDGDRRPDLYIGSCGCCTIGDSTGGAAYSFSMGFAAARQLWTMDRSARDCGAWSDQIADLDGDGLPEIIVSARDADIAIVDGRNGTIRWRIPAPASGAFYPGSTVFPVNIDGDPARELVVVTNGYYASGNRGARRIAVWDYTGGMIPFTMLWEATGSDRVRDEVISLRDAIGDFDGDGTIEVAFQITTGGTPRVEVRNALTGAMRAMQPSARLVGAADLNDDGRVELLLQESNTLSAYRLLRGSGLVAQWFIRDRQPVDMVDHDRWLTDANASRTLALNMDDDPALELIVSGTDAMGRSTLWALNANTDPPTEIGRFSADSGTTILAAGVGERLTQPYPQVLSVTSDGYLTVLDRMMRPTNRITEGEIQLPGMRVGGYYSGYGGLGPTPVVATLGSPAILVRDSRPALLRLDASRASLLSPPTTVWERSKAFWPLVADLDGDGARDIAVLENVGEGPDARWDVVALDAASARVERWRTNGPAGTSWLADLLPARRGSAVDIVYPRSLPGSILQAVAVEGRTGTVRWSGFSRALSWGYIPHAVADMNNDGTDDFVSVVNNPLVLNGTDGSLLYENSTFVAYALPLITDVDGNGSPEAWFHGGYYADRLLSNTMTNIAVRSDHTSPHSYAWAALVTCSGAPAVVAGAFRSAHLWTVRLRDASPLAHKVLVDGQVYAPDRVPMDRREGFLGNVSSVPALRPGGSPAVLVGSTDGFLYALDACTLDRIWSLDFRYPVGEPVIADTNGDSINDVLVTCADGFLYQVGNAALDAPTEVIDIDPDSSILDSDVDEIDTVDTLHARWTAVPGATSYEVGVFSASGTEVRFPNYRNVGNVTSARLDMLALRQGQRYFVSVRPIGASGPGLEARSDGVTVTDRLPPTAEVRVTPQRAWPPSGVTPMVEATCRDRVGLRRMQLEVLAMDGSTLRVLDQSESSSLGTTRTARTGWDGRTTDGSLAPPGEYRVRLLCEDLRMRQSRAEAMVTLDPSVMLPDASTDAATSDASSVTDALTDTPRDGAPGSSPRPGCGCRAGRSTIHPVALIAFALSLALFRRRQRACPARRH